jgi:2-polyprenyl-6-methoxyphenol hydroxylase-like FAD-dependent oxidoreductase
MGHAVRTVLISGAGIAGLALALRLHQRGFVPVLVERAQALRDGGYMLALSDPGYDAADRLGISDALRAAEYLPQRMVALDGAGREKFAFQGRALEIMAGERQLNLMRGDIERILHERVRDAVEIRFGAAVDALDLHPDGVCARLDDGTMIEGDMIAGADGLHSRVRALGFGPEERFLHFLGSRVAAFILDRADFPDLDPDTTYSITEVGRAAGLAAVSADRLVAFFIFRTGRQRQFESVEAELRHAFAGCGWRIPEIIAQTSRAQSVYFDEVSQSVVSPRWAQGRVVLVGDAAYAVSLVAGKGATLAMGGAVKLADALAESPRDPAAAFALYEARLRPEAEAAQALARRNRHLFTPPSRLRLRAHEIGLQMATWPPLAHIAKRLLNPAGARL